MNLKYGQFDILEQELEKLPPLHRVAFAAACCERLYPHLDIFVREITKQGWNEENFFRVAQKSCKISIFLKHTNFKDAREGSGLPESFSGNISPMA